MAPNKEALQRRLLRLSIWLTAGGGVFIFVLWPLCSVLWESLHADGKFDLNAYGGLFTNNWPLVVNSFTLAAGTAALATLLALVCAVWLNFGPQRGRGVIWGTMVLSTVSPPFLCSMAYLMLFGRRGLVTWKLLGLHWNPYGFHGILLMETFSMAGMATILIAASLQEVDGELERVSLNLGASPLRTFSHVTLPLALPGIATAYLLSFVRSLSDFGTPLFVGGQTQVLASKAYSTLVGVGDFQLACAMNTLLFLPALLLLVPFKFKRRHYFSLRLAGARSLRLSRHFMCMIAAVALPFAAMQLLVYVLIFTGALTKTWGSDFSFTTAHLATLLTVQGRSYLRSLTCALTAGIGGAAVGAAIAHACKQMTARLASCVQFTFDLPFILPGTFFGVGYLLAASSLPFTVNVTFLIAMNCLFRQLSPAIRSCGAGLQQMNPELEDCIHDLGGGEGHVFRDLLIHQLKRFMLFSFVNSFSTAMTSTGPLIFLVTPRAKVASVELFEAINSGKFGEAAAMGSLLILSVMSVNILVWRLLRK